MCGLQRFGRVVFILFIGNLIVFGLTTISGLFFGSQYPIWRGLAAAVVLTIAWVWQIPLGIVLIRQAKFGGDFLGILGVNIICSIQILLAAVFGLFHLQYLPA